MTDIHLALAVLADLGGPEDRLIAADAFDEAGLPATAKLLRDPDMPPLVLAAGRLYAASMHWGLPGPRTGVVLNFLPPDGWLGLYKWVSLYCPPKPFGQILWSLSRHRDWRDYSKNPRRSSPRQQLCQPFRNNFFLAALGEQDAILFQNEVCGE